MVRPFRTPDLNSFTGNHPAAINIYAVAIGVDQVFQLGFTKLVSFRIGYRCCFVHTTIQLEGNYPQQSNDFYDAFHDRAVWLENNFYPLGTFKWNIVPILHLLAEKHQKNAVIYVSHSANPLPHSLKTPIFRLRPHQMVFDH